MDGKSKNLEEVGSRFPKEETASAEILPRKLQRMSQDLAQTRVKYLDSTKSK